MCVLLSNHLQQLMQDHQSKNCDHAESSMQWSVVDDNARTPDQELLKKLQESSSSTTVAKSSLNSMSLIDAVAAGDGNSHHTRPSTALSSSSSTKKEEDDVDDGSNDIVVNGLLQQADNISIPSLILGGRRACSHDTGLELYAACGRRQRCIGESICNNKTTTTMTNDSWTVLQNVDQVLSILLAQGSLPPNILINNEDKVASSASMKNTMASFSRCTSHESFLTTATFRQGRRPGSKW